MTVHDAGHPKRLPQVVSDLALRLGADPDCTFDTVGFSQTGAMRISLKSRLWLPFTARQTISVRSCAFAWNARFRPLGYMTVTDALENSLGRLDVTALGMIPVARSKPSAALTRVETIRYLAELPLAPDALLHNHDINWRLIDASTLAVSAGSSDTACEVVLGLDRSNASSAPSAPTARRARHLRLRLCHGAAPSPTIASKTGDGYRPRRRWVG